MSKWTVEFEKKSAWIWEGEIPVVMSARSDAEQDARLVLMAAAPDLLEACKRAVTMISVEIADGEYTETYKVLRDAIAKAEVTNES